MGFGKLLTRGKTGDQLRNAGSFFEVVIDGQPVADPMRWYGGGMGVPGAWRAALMISDALGAAPWDAYELDDDGMPATKVTPRPVLLDKPYPEEPRMNTFSSWVLDLIWHGNAVALIAGRDASGVPDAVLPIPAAHCGVRRIGSESISALPVGPVEYQVGSQVFGPHEVLHVKGPCRPSEVRGIGVLESHLTGAETAAYGGTLDLARELQRQARSVSQHGVPTGYLKSENPDLVDTEAKDLKSKWLAAQRDRTVAVLNATTSFEPLAWNPSEMQLIEARKMSLLEIALVFGVQPSALAVESSSRTYRNDNAEDVKFTKFGLAGHVARMEHALAALFPDRIVVQADLNHIKAADLLTAAQADEIRIRSRTLLPNEARARDGLKPLPGGDEFPPAAAPPDANSNEQETDDGDTEEQQPGDNQGA